MKINKKTRFPSAIRQARKAPRLPGTDPQLKTAGKKSAQNHIYRSFCLIFCTVFIAYQYKKKKTDGGGNFNNFFAVHIL